MPVSVRNLSSATGYLPSRLHALLSLCDVRSCAPRAKEKSDEDNRRVSGSDAWPSLSPSAAHMALHARQICVLTAVLLSIFAGVAFVGWRSSYLHAADLSTILSSLDAAGGFVPLQLRAAVAAPPWCVGADLAPPFESACTVPIVLYAWNRPAYLARTLSRLQAVHEHVSSLPGWAPGVPPLQILISLDGPHSGALEAIAVAVARGAPVCRVFVHGVPSFHAPSVLALKEHWLWMVEQAFERAPELSGHTGPVLFLEDDMELALEALHVFRWLAGVAASRCTDCWGGALSIGGFSDGAAPDRSTALIRAGHSNSGFFFNRTTSRLINASLPHMHAFPDGWDWALSHLSHVGALPPRAAVPALSRVTNFGAVGLTVTEREYERLGLGAAPQSTASASDFLEAMRAAGASSSYGLTVADAPIETGAMLGPREHSRTAAGTVERCPLCRAEGVVASDGAMIAGSRASSGAPAGIRI